MNKSYYYPICKLISFSLPMLCMIILTGLLITHCNLNIHWASNWYWFILIIH